MQVKRVAARRAPAQPPQQPIRVITFDDRQRVIMFFELLMVIDRRLSGRSKKKPKTKIDPKEISSSRSQSKRRAVSFVYNLYLFIAALFLLHQQINYQLAVSTMIDTIVLTLNKQMYEVTKPELFKPSAKWVLNKHAHANFIQSRQNPTKMELLRGIYKPRLTLSNRIGSLGKHEVMLKIALSLPKLVHGNNFVELRYKDFAVLSCSARK